MGQRGPPTRSVYRPPSPDVEIVECYLFSFFILRRVGKDTAQAHRASTYFYTRRVSIQLNYIRNPALAGVSFGSRGSDSLSCPVPIGGPRYYYSNVHLFL